MTLEEDRMNETVVELSELTNQLLGQYELAVVCSNCQYSGIVSIKKGKVVAETPCSNCGNKTLHKDPLKITN